MRSLLLSFVISLLPIVAFGEGCDSSQVIQIASAYLGTNHCSIVKTSKAYCIVQRNDDVGFVVISLNENDKRRLLGYAENSVWEEEKMPLALIGWLQHMDSVYATKSQTQNDTYQPKYHTNQKKTILPLLTCHWHQNSPYNDLAPVIEDGNVKTVAGCVAIAAAQITYYWRNDNPESTLKDTPVYPYGSAPVTMSIPKGSPNNWELMKDSYSADDSPESRYAAAQLCYVLGTTSYLDYGSSTGGQIFDASNAMYSQYNLLSTYVSRNKYSQDEWEELIYQELDHGRPIMCSGSGDGGHAFVLDGYDAAIDLYHFNFGWGGSGDGYYPVDGSENAMGGYYKNQSIVYNIRPKNRNIETCLKAQKSEVNGKIDVIIDITNKSTLDIKCLKLYIVPNGKALNETDSPVWQYEDTIACDSISRQIVARQLTPLSAPEYMLYLTDENAYVVGQQLVDLESGIQNVSMEGTAQQRKIYDLRGQEIKTPRSGVHVIDFGGKRKKVIVK